MMSDYMFNLVIDAHQCAQHTLPYQGAGANPGDLRRWLEEHGTLAHSGRAELLSEVIELRAKLAAASAPALANGSVDECPLTEEQLRDLAQAHGGDPVPGWLNGYTLSKRSEFARWVAWITGEARSLRTDHATIRAHLQGEASR